MQQKTNTSLQHRFKPKNVLLTTLAVLLVPTLTYGQTQSGTLDTSFGTGGKVTTAIAGLNDQASQVVLQRDGKIVVAGRSYIAGPNFTGDFHSSLVRYNSWGTLDAGFGTSGEVTMIFGGDSDGVSSITVQPDGKIVVSGGATIDWNSKFALARFN